MFLESSYRDNFMMHCPEGLLSATLRSLLMKSPLFGKLSGLLVAAVLALAGGSRAEASVLLGNVADAWLTGTSAGDGSSGTGASAAYGATSSNVFVGRTSTGTVGLVVYVFQLPTLAVGESIGSASFTFTQLTNSSALTANIDLYGLNYRTASTVTVADYFVGSLDSTSATLLKDNWFTSGTLASANTAYTTDGGASSNLTAYLNAQYVAGAVGGNYVFLRLNYDAFSDVGRIEAATANNSTEAYRPLISYTIVPEPQTWALLGTGLFLLVMMRRRRHV